MNRILRFLDHFPKPSASYRLLDCLVAHRRVNGKTVTAVAHLISTPDGDVEMRMALYACHISDVEAERLTIATRTEA